VGAGKGGGGAERDDLGEFIYGFFNGAINSPTQIRGSIVLQILGYG
jgi:hypothetical protein